MSTRIQFIKFGLVGVLNTLVHYLVFLLLFRLVGVPMMAASAIGYMTGVLNSFFVNRKWTFKVSGDSSGSELVKFFTVNVVSLGVNLAALYVVSTWLGVLPEIAQVMAIFCTLVVNFSGNKWWTFKSVANEEGG